VNIRKLHWNHQSSWKKRSINCTKHRNKSYTPIWKGSINWTKQRNKS